MTVADTFETMLTQFNPAKAAGIDKTLQWNISGDTGGKWAIHVHDQSCELIPGGVEHPDIVFQTNETDWLALSEGKLNATMAFMSGKVKIMGDMGLAMKVRALFPDQQR
jgi:putative sterol carrier protein